MAYFQTAEKDNQFGIVLKVAGPRTFVASVYGCV
jgi:hypothetical protein